MQQQLNLESFFFFKKLHRLKVYFILSTFLLFLSLVPWNLRAWLRLCQDTQHTFEHRRVSLVGIWQNSIHLYYIHCHRAPMQPHYVLDKIGRKIETRARNKTKWDTTTTTKNIIRCWERTTAETRPLLVDFRYYKTNCEWLYPAAGCQLDRIWLFLVFFFAFIPMAGAQCGLFRYNNLNLFLYSERRSKSLWNGKDKSVLRNRFITCVWAKKKKTHNYQAMKHKCIHKF